jgi:hypothetical protein
MGLKKGGLDTRLRRYPGPTRRGGLEHLGEFMSSYTAENEKKGHHPHVPPEEGKGRADRDADSLRLPGRARA